MICQSPSKSVVYACPKSGGCVIAVVQVPLGNTVTGCPIGQSVALTSAEFQAYMAAPAASSPGNSITVKDAFGTATPEQYQAIAAVFGLVLTAACVIWGAKRVLFLFRHPSES